jgi:hypothetical protein
MMRTTSSRPNTAKKALTSPKGHRTKTEGRDLDVNQLCDAMYQLPHAVRRR